MQRLLRPPHRALGHPDMTPSQQTPLTTHGQVFLTELHFGWREGAAKLKVRAAPLHQPGNCASDCYINLIAVLVEREDDAFPGHLHEAPAATRPAHLAGCDLPVLDQMLVHVL